MINTQHCAPLGNRFEATRTELARSNRVLIENFLEANMARELNRCLHHHTPWEMVYREADQNKTLSRAQLESASFEEQNTLHAQIVDEAKNGYQFCFDRYPMLDAYLQGDSTVPLLNQFLEKVNQTEFLDYCRQLTGDHQIRKVELQATRYRGGSFLKEHDDHAQIKDDRRYACVFGLTENWAADWGGVLQFTKHGRVIESFHPLFNSLSVFKVPQTHQVSYVAPFAIGARYALTGWMRAD